MSWNFEVNSILAVGLFVVIGLLGGLPLKKLKFQLSVAILLLASS